MFSLILLVRELFCRHSDQPLRISVARIKQNFVVAPLLPVSPKTIKKKQIYFGNFPYAGEKRRILFEPCQTDVPDALSGRVSFSSRSSLIAQSLTIIAAAITGVLSVSALIQKKTKWIQLPVDVSPWFLERVHAILSLCRYVLLVTAKVLYRCTCIYIKFFFILSWLNCLAEPSIVDTRRLPFVFGSEKKQSSIAFLGSLHS